MGLLSASLAERVQRSELGPVIRGAVSRAKAPRWRSAGSPAPAPPHLKVAIVEEHARRFQPFAFVETGTYRGDTIARIAPLVTKSFSIELDAKLATMARARFVDDPSISILQGDSAEMISEVLSEVDLPTLFWLDGHYSGGVTAGASSCPVEAELRAILAEPVDHVVLVDDARCFDGTNGYPTVEEVKALVSELQPTREMQVADDIMRIYPRPGR